LRFRNIVREPLLHFLLIGLALFVYYGRVAPSDNHRIVVSQALVDDLARQFQATWSRPPTDQELAGLVDTYIHDEILYREGQALGLGRDDVVIKRRVRQKLEVMSEEEAARTEPSDADLAAYVNAHPDSFRKPATVTFEQILVATKGSGADIARALASTRSALEGGADPGTLGQATLLPSHVEGSALDLVARDFGEQFAGQLESLPVGQWAGPLTSSFGVHLVRVSARRPSLLPSLDSVRALVAREWENAQRKRALEESYRRLRQTYAVVIEAKLPGTPPR